jgi:hypothetical protein
VTPSTHPYQSVLRLAALGLQAVTVTLLLLLVLAVAPTPLRNELQSLLGSNWNFFGFAPPSGRSLLIGVGLALVVTAVGILWASWRLQGRSWRRIALGYVVLGVVLAYLAHDDATIRRPVSMEVISPVFPGAEASFNVLMLYGRYHPLGKNFKAFTFNDPYPLFNPEPADKWRATITTHRAELEAHWRELAPERAWLAKLNEFDRIGDLTPTRVDAEVIAFQPLRTVTQHGIAIASLQALDGHGDDAVETLLPVLQLGRKLQPYSRTLVRSMVGAVIERLSIQTAAFILDNSVVSPGARTRLAAALQGGDPGDGGRRLISAEYAFELGALNGTRLGDFRADYGGPVRHPWLRQFFNSVSPFVYNPRATFNIYGDLYLDLEDIIGRRQLDQLDPRMKRFFTQDVRPTFKNFFGKLLAQMFVPAYSKVSESYWRTQDMRGALLARLSRP